MFDRRIKTQNEPLGKCHKMLYQIIVYTVHWTNNNFTSFQGFEFKVKKN